MRFWADVFTAQDVKIGSALNLTSASVTKALDGAGSFSLSFPAADKSAFQLLTEERKVRIYIEQDDMVRLFGSGVIRDVIVDDTPSGAKGSVTGPDSLDALTRKSVLLGRAYENQILADIASDLIGLVPPWSISASTNFLQTARFDGVSVLKALIRVAQNQGFHIREGTTPNTLEMDTFGEDSGIKAVKPDTLTSEIYGRDDLLIIEKLKRKSSSREVVNWIIPLGAGEGTAALTMKHAINVTPPSLVGPDGTLLYYLFDQDSIDAYGQIEKIVTFKEIVPTSNNQSIRAFAAELLYDAATAWLARNSVPLVTYSLTAKKNRGNLRPGDKIRIAYEGLVETESSTFTYLNVNELFWVMKITETINESGVRTQLEVNTVDRLEKDATEMVVDGLEAIEVKNISTQTYPVWITTREMDVIWGSPSPGDVHERKPVFYLNIDDGVTDIIQVTLHFTSEPAYTTTEVTTSLTWDGDKYAYYTQAPNYPATIHLIINGTDVTSEFGGPWGSVGAGADVEIDITEKIAEAAGGLYRNHTIQFSCANASGERSYAPHTTSSGDGQSGGIIRCEIRARLVVKN